jgi:hypothetical protein
MQNMQALRASLCVFIVLGTVTFLRAQDAATEPSAVVTFTLDFPHSDPDHYAIVIRQDGRGSYDCTARVSDESEQREPYHFDFDLPEARRRAIFELAAKAKYFAAKVDSGNPKLAFTGDKTLSYRDAARQSSATYNYSTNATVQQLTSMFQNMAATLDHARKLAFYHHYQKLALDEELKTMERQAQSNELGDIEIISPTLQQIVADQSVLNVVRARAQRLLDMSKTGPASR